MATITRDGRVYLVQVCVGRVHREGRTWVAERFAPRYGDNVRLLVGADYRSRHEAVDAIILAQADPDPQPEHANGDKVTTPAGLGAVEGYDSHGAVIVDVDGSRYHVSRSHVHATTQAEDHPTQDPEYQVWAEMEAAYDKAED
jgi:hypothetical protein